MDSVPMRPEITHGYIARCRICNGWVLICSDEPDNAKDVASAVRRGHIIERYPVEEQKKMVHEGVIAACYCRRAARTALKRRDARMAKYVPLESEGKPK